MRGDRRARGLAGDRFQSRFAGLCLTGSEDDSKAEA